MTSHPAPAWRLAAGALAALLVAACADVPVSTPSAPTAAAARFATIQRTAHGVAHIAAPDFETLAHGMAWAHAEDNVCQTADHLVTVRGERARTFGPTATGLLGLRRLPNEQIDLFIAAHMDDAALARAAATQSEAARALARGYVAGYNRFLAENAARLPAECSGAAWVKPMTEPEYRRIAELSAVQAGVAALADALLAAAPPKPAGSTSSAPAGASASASASAIDVAAAAEAMRAAGLVEPPFGSNAWAFGRESTGTGRGMLLGNPHFPWTGTNRFWQVHLTVPGQIDVMGVAIGTVPVVVIGFNKDIAWSHTVSTGRRFTLHELKLVPGEPTAYLVDGQPEKMRAQIISVDVGAGAPRTQTIWQTRYGPVIVMPRAGLGWSAERAYALQDANSGNVRSVDTWLGLARAASVHDVQRSLSNLGTPWVNTIAADRHGNAFYADASVVPDVDAALLQRCAPSDGARRLLAGAGLVVLDGSRGDCQWRRDAASPVPGLTPIARLPAAVRGDWLHNSNDSFFHSHPKQTFGPISPLVGDDVIRQLRTRAGFIEIPELLAGGPVTLPRIQRQLFANRNHAAERALPDLLAACAVAGSAGGPASGAATASAPAPAVPSIEAREGCAVLARWDRRSDLDSRGAHLFREFWRQALSQPKLWRVPPDKAQPVATPTGLNLADAAVAAKVWEALDAAVKKVRAAGFALDATLAEVQRPAITEEPIALHGGHGFEGVLNYLGDNGSPGIGKGGIRIDYGTSYVQTVTFDERGPLAEALLTYGQSAHRGSPHAADQLRLYSRKQWPRLPFHAEDVARQRVGEVRRLEVR